MRLSKEQLFQNRSERLARQAAISNTDAFLIYDPRTLQWLTGRPDIQCAWVEAATGSLRINASILETKKVESLGIIGAVPPKDIVTITNQAKRITDASSVVLPARRTKDPVELTHLKRAATITKTAFSAATWEHSSSQRDISISILGGILNERGDGWAYDPSIACDEEANKIWSEPTDMAISDSNLIVIDAAASYQNYKADCTVTLERNRSSEHLKLIDVMRKLTEAISNGLRECSEIALTANRLLKESGFNELPHAIGHGVGLELHEHPFLTRKSCHSLQPGDVFMLEPAFYHPTKGSRIESMFTIDANGELICLLDAITLGDAIERNLP